MGRVIILITLGVEKKKITEKKGIRNVRGCSESNSAPGKKEGGQRFLLAAGKKRLNHDVIQNRAEKEVARKK